MAFKRQLKVTPFPSHLPMVMPNGGLLHSCSRPTALIAPTKVGAWYQIQHHHNKYPNEPLILSVTLPELSTNAT
eukprot:1158599-Pelagomonas_calceolata.AAC.24